MYIYIYMHTLNSLSLFITYRGALVGFGERTAPPSKEPRWCPRLSPKFMECGCSEAGMPPPSHSSLCPSHQCCNWWEGLQ